MSKILLTIVFFYKKELIKNGSEKSGEKKVRIFMCVWGFCPQAADAFGLNPPANWLSGITGERF